MDTANHRMIHEDLVKRGHKLEFTLANPETPTGFSVDQSHGPHDKKYEFWINYMPDTVDVKAFFSMDRVQLTINQIEYGDIDLFDIVDVAVKQAKLVSQLSEHAIDRIRSVTDARHYNEVFESESLDKLRILPSSEELAVVVRREEIPDPDIPDRNMEIWPFSFFDESDTPIAGFQTNFGEFRVLDAAGNEHVEREKLDVTWDTFQRAFAKLADIIEGHYKARDLADD